MVKSRILFTLSLLFLVAGIAFGGGWQLNEHGARATAMGGAFVARSSDLSAMYFNPAGLTNISGINVLLGGTLILPSSKFKGPSPSTTETNMESNIFLPPNLYGSYQFNDQWTFGLGIYTPYGLGTEWNRDWVGRKLSVKANLQTFYINPSAAYKVNEKLSVGVGVSYVYGSVELIQRVGNGTANDGTLTLNGTGSSFTFNVGVQYKPMEKLSVGVSYRSLAKVEFSGDAKFTDMASLQPYFPGGSGTATLPMPANLFLGAAYQVMPNLTVEGDFQWVAWSAYDQLKLGLPVGPVFPLTGQPLQGPQTIDKKWVDGYLFRLGGEYTLNEKMMLRGGFILDLSPQPPSKTEPMLPDADRTDFTLGVGYKVNEQVNVDVAYMLVLFQERDAKASAFPGTYNSSAHLLGVNVGYRF